MRGGIRLRLEVASTRSRNIVIRPVEDSDASLLAHHMSDSEIIRNFGLALLDANDVKATDILRRYYAIRKWNDLGLSILVNDEPAGVIELTSLHLGGRAWIAYWLGRKFWHKGIMTDVVKSTIKWAFTQYNLPEMTTAVMPWNDASKKVLLKAGFVSQGLNASPSYDAQVGGTYYKEEFKILRGSVPNT